jgi:translation initiation factor 3 subunit E
MTNSAATTNAAAAAETWDLTSSISPFLDVHLLFPILESLETSESTKGLYSSKDIVAARLELLKSTNMVDYALEIAKGPNGVCTTADEASMVNRKKVVLATLERLQSAAQPLVDAATTKAKYVENSNWNVAGLRAANKAIDSKVIDSYRELAKFNYECGDYELSLEMLNNYLALFAEAPSSSSSSNKRGNNDDDDEKEATPSNTDNTPFIFPAMNASILATLWGKLAAEILHQKYETAMITLVTVKNAIESMVTAGAITPLEALQQRTWLLHHALFVFWNNSKESKGLDAIIDLFTTEKYMQAIQTNAPHLLRYLAAAIILNKRSRHHLKELVKVIKHCAPYTDPILEFVDCLYARFDFEGAQVKLLGCAKVLEADFFLCKQSQFMEEARVFIFENYCKIHTKIEIKTLGEKLAMDQDQAERWIVDLIRNAYLDAKIDSTENTVIMGTSTPSVYQSVISKTKDLGQRSSTLASTLSGLMSDAKKDKARKERLRREEEQEM